MRLDDGSTLDGAVRLSVGLDTMLCTGVTAARDDGTESLAGAVELVGVEAAGAGVVGWGLSDLVAVTLGDGEDEAIGAPMEWKRDGYRGGEVSREGG